MDILSLLNLAGYLLWPLFIIVVVVVLKDPKAAWHMIQVFWRKLFGRSNQE